MTFVYYVYTHFMGLLYEYCTFMRHCWKNQYPLWAREMTQLTDFLVPSLTFLKFQASITFLFIVPMVTGRFAHFPVRPESFRPESFRPRVVSPSITWVVSPSYPESFRPLFDESFRPLSKFIFYWGYCDKFTIFVSFNEDFGYISLKTDMSFISWSKWCKYLYSV